MKPSVLSDLFRGNIGCENMPVTKEMKRALSETAENEEKLLVTFTPE